MPIRVKETYIKECLLNKIRRILLKEKVAVIWAVGYDYDMIDRMDVYAIGKR